jgi:hypothetical protein
VNTTKTEYALHYRAQGLTPIPLHDLASGFCSCHEGNNCTSSGKHPRVKRQQAIEADGLAWKGWVEAWPDMNIGILTGEDSGVFAVDIDPRHGGDKSLEALIKANGPLPATPCASTGGGGTHYLFMIPDGMTIKNSVGDAQGNGGVAPGIDIRGNGGLIVVEPSFTKGGYTWVSNLPERQSIALPPDWLLSATPDKSKPRPSAQNNFFSGLIGFTMPPDCFVEEGGRNNFLARAAGWLKRQGVKDAPLFEMLKALNTAKCNPPVDDREVEQVAASINKYPSAANDSGWPQPEEIKHALPPVPVFDPNMLPAALRHWVTDIAAQMQCPVEFLAVGAMVAAGAMVGNRIGIQPKQHDISWVEVPNLWGAVVGRPGVMKSPALAKVLAPLKRLEDKKLQAFQSVLAQYQIDKMYYEASKKSIEAQIKKGATVVPHQLPVEPQAPPQPRLLLNDATYQKLGQVLSDNPHGVLVFQDELAGLLVRLDTVGQEPARAFYLEAWNGLQPYVFDRIERGTIRIPKLCFSLLGGLQPSKLREYLRGAVSGGKTDDGLAQRLQLLVYPDISKDWTRVDRIPDILAIQTADKVFDRLDSLDPAALGANIPMLGDGIPTLSFNDAAQVMFNNWWGKLELSLRSGNRHPALESHLSKFRKLIPALALLDHLIEGTGGPITEASLARAILWGKFLFQHAKRAYAAVTASSKDAAKSLADKLLQGALTDGFTVRDVYRKNWSMLTDPKEAAEALEILIDSGWLRAQNDKVYGADGRSTVRYFINPSLVRAA